MSQNYTPTKWVDNRTVGTASVMNNMEKGIEDAHNRIDGVDSQIKDNTSRIEVLENTENGTSIDVIDDENISVDKAYSSNKITEITNGLSTRINDNKRRLDELQLTGGTNEIVFDIFPSDEVLNSLPMNSTFEVKGFYEVGDMPKCMYQKLGYAQNCIKKATYYIKPITDSESTLFLPYLGIRSGAKYSVQNSDIIAKTDFKFGSVLKLPTGDYYFDRPLNLAGNQLSLIGECMSFTFDPNTKGITILVFNNLAESEKAITVGAGTLSNITVRGNMNHYNYSIDREKTYVDKENIEQETCVVKCYGIFGGSITNITNVRVEYFYYGCYLNTNNIYITDFYARKCHIGLSIGSDTKCKGIYGWDVHTLLQMRNSISSAVQVRADSCHHLVHLTGYSAGIQLTDLDGDYCVGSLIKVGVYNEDSNIEDVVINGVTGRACCINAYDTSKDTKPTSSNITEISDVSNWGFISVENQTKLNGAIITIAKSDISGNPFDSSSTYKTPPILLASAGVAYVMFNTTFKNNYGTYGDVNIDRQTLLDGIALLSGNANSARICLNTPSGAYYLHKESPVTIYTKKQVTEELGVGDSGETIQYTISNSLSNVTTSNNATLINANTSYSTTITPNNGYTLSTVRVTMGGTDITSSVYSNGVITIASVTGNIVITATAESSNLVDSTGAYMIDDFTGTSLDRSKWDYEWGYVRNGELQNYQDNAVVNNGILELQGRKDSNGTWTSASIISKGHFAFMYGKIECRAKIDPTWGSFGAFWTLGDSFEYRYNNWSSPDVLGEWWAYCGEFDIMEFYNGNFTCGTFFNEREESGRVYYNDYDFNDWHTFAMEWLEDGTLIFSIDGNEISRTSATDNRAFHIPHFILINQAIGASGGTPADSTTAITQYIDWVKYYPASTSNLVLNSSDFSLEVTDTNDSAHNCMVRPIFHDNCINKSLTWSSSDSSLVWVYSGLCGTYAGANGTVTITATSHSGVSKSITLTVTDGTLMAVHSME